MFVVSIAAVFSWFLLQGIIPYLHNNLLDHPNHRSSHRKPTPRGGGLSFVLVASMCSLYELLSGNIGYSTALPLLVLPLAIVGFVDDRHNLPAVCRYAVQILTAVFILGLCPFVQEYFLSTFPSSRLYLPALALLVIAITAIINFTNFMDGLDGLVAGCMSVAIAALSLTLSGSRPLWALVGALFGFLVCNWSPAKVFMGDVGSTFLGAVFAGLVLQASSWPEAFASLLVATPLLGDACICVLRRLFAGHRVFQAHRLHLFQRLYQSGWPHAQVSLAYIFSTAVLAAAFFVGGLPWVAALAVLVLLIGFWLDQQVAVPFAEASKS